MTGTRSIAQIEDDRDSEIAYKEALAAIEKRDLILSTFNECTIVHPEELPIEIRSEVHRLLKDAFEDVLGIINNHYDSYENFIQDYESQHGGGDE